MRWKNRRAYARLLVEIPSYLLCTYIFGLGIGTFLEQHRAIGLPLLISSMVGTAVAFVLLFVYYATESIRAFREGMTEGKSDSSPSANQ
jgi:hypothetical protein